MAGTDLTDIPSQLPQIHPFIVSGGLLLRGEGLKKQKYPHRLNVSCFRSSDVFFITEASRFHFPRPENYISMYHQEGNDTLFVGGRAMIYVLTFSNRGVRDLLVRKEAASSSPSQWSVEETEGLKKKRRFRSSSQTRSLPELSAPQRSLGFSASRQSSESASSFSRFSQEREEKKNEQGEQLCESGVSV